MLLLHCGPVSLQLCVIVDKSISIVLWKIFCDSLNLSFALLSDVIFKIVPFLHYTGNDN